MKRASRWLMALVGIVGMAIMVAFQMSLDIGLSPWDGLSLTIARVSGVKVGNMTLYIGILAVLVQLFVLRKEFKITHFLQIIVGILMGKVINLFYYYVFSNLRFNNYVISVFLFVLSVFLFAYFVSLVQVADTINLPLEGMTQVLSKSFGVSYSKFRFGIDIVSVILILFLIYVFKVPNTIREGTIISALLFGPALGKIISWLEEKEMT